MKQTESTDVSTPICHLKKTELLPTRLLFSNRPHWVLSKAIISPAKSFLGATTFLSVKNTGEAKINYSNKESQNGNRGDNLVNPCPVLTAELQPP